MAPHRYRFGPVGTRVPSARCGSSIATRIGIAATLNLLLDLNAKNLARIPVPATRPMFPADPGAVCVKPSSHTFCDCFRDIVSVLSPPTGHNPLAKAILPVALFHPAGGP